MRGSYKYLGTKMLEDTRFSYQGKKKKKKKSSTLRVIESGFWV